MNSDTLHYRGSVYGPRTTYNPALYATQPGSSYPPPEEYVEGGPGNMTVLVPRVVYDKQEETYEVPKLVIETATRTVPRTRRVLEKRVRMVREPVTVLEEVEQTVQIPRIEMEEVVIKVPKTIYEPVQRTVKVPTTVMRERAVTYDAPIEKMEYQEEIYQVPKTIYETKTRTVQAPRVVMEPKTITPMQVTYQKPVTTERIEYIPRVIRETKFESETKYFYPGQTGAAGMTATMAAVNQQNIVDNATRSTYYKEPTLELREIDLKGPYSNIAGAYSGAFGNAGMGTLRDGASPTTRSPTFKGMPAGYGPCGRTATSPVQNDNPTHYRTNQYGTTEGMGMIGSGGFNEDKRFNTSSAFYKNGCLTLK